jgi:hypothetical protein
MCISLDLQVFSIWDLGSTVWPDLSKLSRPSQAKLVVWEALRSVPSHVPKRGYGPVYFWEDARMDSLAAALTMSLGAQVCSNQQYCSIKE